MLLVNSDQSELSQQRTIKTVQIDLIKSHEKSYHRKRPLTSLMLFRSHKLSYTLKWSMSLMCAAVLLSWQELNYNNERTSKKWRLVPTSVSKAFCLLMSSLVHLHFLYISTGQYPQFFQIILCSTHDSYD